MYILALNGFGEQFDTEKRKRQQMYFIVDQKATSVRIDYGRRQRFNNRSYKPTVDNAESDSKSMSNVHES